MMISKNICAKINVHAITYPKKINFFQNYTMFKHIDCSSLQLRKGSIIVEEFFVYCESATYLTIQHYFSIFNKPLPIIEGENRLIIAIDRFNSNSHPFFNPRDLFSLMFRYPIPNTFWKTIHTEDHELKVIISTNKVPSLALLARAYIPRQHETDMNSYPIPLSKSRTHLIQISI